MIKFKNFKWVLVLALILPVALQGNGREREKERSERSHHAEVLLQRLQIKENRRMNRVARAAEMTRIVRTIELESVGSALANSAKDAAIILETLQATYGRIEKLETAIERLKAGSLATDQEAAEKIQTLKLELDTHQKTAAAKVRELIKKHGAIVEPTIQKFIDTPGNGIKVASDLLAPSYWARVGGRGGETVHNLPPRLAEMLYGTNGTPAKPTVDGIMFALDHLSGAEAVELRATLRDAFFEFADQNAEGLTRLSLRDSIGSLMAVNREGESLSATTDVGLLAAVQSGQTAHAESSGSARRTGESQTLGDGLSPEHKQAVLKGLTRRIKGGNVAAVRDFLEFFQGAKENSKTGALVLEMLDALHAIELEKAGGNELLASINLREAVLKAKGWDNAEGRKRLDRLLARLAKNNCPGIGPFQGCAGGTCMMNLAGGPAFVRAGKFVPVEQIFTLAF